MKIGCKLPISSKLNKLKTGIELFYFSNLRLAKSNLANNFDKNSIIFNPFIVLIFFRDNDEIICYQYLLKFPRIENHFGKKIYLKFYNKSTFVLI